MPLTLAMPQTLDTFPALSVYMNKPTCVPKSDDGFSSPCFWLSSGFLQPVWILCPWGLCGWASQSRGNTGVVKALHSAIELEPLRHQDPTSPRRDFPIKTLEKVSSTSLQFWELKKKSEWKLSFKDISFWSSVMISLIPTLLTFCYSKAEGGTLFSLPIS